jgi:CBS domain-containing protein
MPPGAWALIGMTSVLSAAIGAPLTAAMLALEMTHNGGLMLPVLLSCVAAYAVSVLVQPRSMLTENLSRRGLHLSREFGVDPLETMLVSQAMHTSVFALPDSATRKDAAEWLRKMEERAANAGDGGASAWSHWQRLFPLVDDEGRLTGLLTRGKMIAVAKAGEPDGALLEDANREPLTVSPFSTLRSCAAMMAETNITSFPVVSADGKLVGVVTIEDLLKGRSEQSHKESDRERVLRLHWPFSRTSVAVPVVEPRVMEMMGSDEAMDVVETPEEPVDKTGAAV